jgi:uncharacterized protein
MHLFWLGRVRVRVMEEKITFPCDPHLLEGYWQAGAANRAVVICHPHPLYGGTMSSPVVETIQTVYGQYGYSTLRFNFRGVGGSRGKYDNGVGEQDDVRAAIAAVKNRGATHISLAGYSFGAWVGAGIIADQRTPVDSMLMVSPPVGHIEFENINTLSCLKLVVTGSRDDIAPVERIRALLPVWNPDAQFEIIDGCDHFYSGQLNRLQSILERYLESEK